SLLLGLSALLRSPGDLTLVFPSCALPLKLAQWGMLLEILHAAAGAVPSPIVPTFLQVNSRIGMLSVLLLAPSLEESSSAGVMALSWSMVEVVRYAFYINSLLVPGGQAGTWYPLFWLRYSLFALLYPTGIGGEVLTMLSAVSDPSFSSLLGGWAGTLLKWVLLLYIPGAPFMYFNMVSIRARAFKKRFAPPRPPPSGVEFPLDAKGLRSTSELGKQAIARAIAATQAPNALATAERCERERSWRFGYGEYIRSLVVCSCDSPAGALASAKAGLDLMYDSMLFYAKGEGGAEGEGKSFRASVEAVKDSFHTGSVKGVGTLVKGYRVPYDAGWHPTNPLPPPHETPLSGDALNAHALKWAERGIIESDAAEALCWTSNYFEKGGTLEGVYVVMIGASSAMGPCAKLLEMGATVVAIDIPGCWGKGGKRPTSEVWRRLRETAQRSAGAIVFPMSKPMRECKDQQEVYEAAGCDLLHQPAEIANWLCEWQAGRTMELSFDFPRPSTTIPATARVAIGNYTYLDGELHVKLALCADYLIARLRKSRPSTSVAFLCTPTDVHVRSDASDTAARHNYGSGRGFEMLLNLLSRGKWLVPNFDQPITMKSGKQVKYVDGLALAQGPNYALAKRMQHWRAMLEFDAGATVSSMVAPSTATTSVLHNRTFGWVYGGMPYFKYEIFKQDTTNAVMAAMLMHDLLNPESPKNPANRSKFKMDNTIELFSTQAVHGGLWCSPYKLDSIGEISALIYFTSMAKPYLLVLTVAAVSAIFVL
ncbi:MAG: hypothetical protein SGPRY_011250, partial [Prymnesium sp.]